MTFNRILPRDAFNDANLLKCIGRLTLLIEDGLIDWIQFHYDGDPFNIEQDPSDGSTFISNISFWTTKEFGHKPLSFWRPLNSRATWPLMMSCDEDEWYAFDEQGKFMPSKLAFKDKAGA